MDNGKVFLKIRIIHRKKSASGRGADKSERLWTSGVFFGKMKKIRKGRPFVLFGISGCLPDKVREEKIGTGIPEVFVPQKQRFGCGHHGDVLLKDWDFFSYRMVLTTVVFYDRIEKIVEKERIIDMQRKIKSLFSLFLVIALSFGFLPAVSLTAAVGDGVAYAVTGGNIYFDPETGVVTGCDESVTEADIPDQIESVAVVEIGDWAFENCSLLTRVSIPSAVTSIGDCAFMGCSSLPTVTIPKRARYVGGLAFSGCTSLTEILVDKNNTSFASDQGVLLSRDKKTLYCCPEGKSGEYTASTFITTVLDNAFDNCKQITRVVFGDRVKTIGAYAFNHCSALVSVNIPNSVTSIGDCAFFGCSILQRISFPSGLSEIGYMAFSECTALRAIALPDTVQKVGDFAFSSCPALNYVVLSNGLEDLPTGLFLNCTALTEVKIPDSVVSVGDWAFSDCSALKSLQFPDSLASIGNHVFDRCDSLTEIHVAADNTVYASEDGVLYTAGKSKLLCCPAGRETSDFVIPGTVTEIGDWALYSYKNLSHVEIPKSVLLIGEGAFEGCTFLSDVVYSGSREQWDQITIQPSNDLLLAARFYEAYEVTGGNLYFDSATGTICLCTESVTEADIPDSINGVAVTSIAADAFCGCPILSVIRIPAGVTHIEGDFCHSSNVLTAIEVAEKNPNYVSVDGALLTKDKKTLIRCPGVSGEYTVPNGVTTIEAFAFSHCSALENLILPSSLTAVKENAFDYCSSLASVQYGGTQADWESVTVENGNDLLLNADWQYLPVETFRLGDVNNDGKVDISDRVVLARWLAKWNVEIHEKAADIDGNKTVNTTDSVLLARHLAKWDISYFK